MEFVAQVRVDESRSVVVTLKPASRLFFFAYQERCGED